MTLSWFQSMDSDTLYRLGLDGQALQNMRELYPDEVFDTGSQMLEGRYCVEESAFSALLELDAGGLPLPGASQVQCAGDGAVFALQRFGSGYHS